MMDLQICYFKDDEFKCPCCGKDAFAILKVRLDEARHYANTPFIINSGMRCKDHNSKIGGSESSSHMLGMAADIKNDYNNRDTTAKIIYGLGKAGFGRILVYETFIHADVDELKHDFVGKYD